MTSVGLTSNKSLTINKLSIPDNDTIFFLFLRGVIDGDGNINKDGINIYSGSIDFLIWIKNELLKRDIKTSLANINSKSTPYLYIGVKYSPLLYKKMYLDFKNQCFNNIKINDLGHNEKQEKLRAISINKCNTCSKLIPGELNYCRKCKS